VLISVPAVFKSNNASYNRPASPVTAPFTPSAVLNAARIEVATFVLMSTSGLYFAYTRAVIVSPGITLNDFDNPTISFSFAALNRSDLLPPGVWLYSNVLLTMTAWL
jgi:hypothetical protein